MQNGNAEEHQKGKGKRMSKDRNQQLRVNRASLEWLFALKLASYVYRDRH